MRGSELYESTAERIIDLVEHADDRTMVPACEGWSVHCLLSHLVGLASDVVTGRVDGYATAPWTEAQVDRGAGRPMEDLVAEWRVLIPTFLEVVDDLAGSSLPSMVETALGPMPKEAFEVAFTVDALQHEHDLRAALNAARPPIAEQDGAVMRAMVTTVRGLFAFADLPTIVLRSSDVDLEWSIGRDEPAAVCEAPLLDLLRSLGGRRTIEQIQRLPWTHDPGDEVIRALVVPFFAAPPTPVEPTYA